MDNQEEPDLNAMRQDVLQEAVAGMPWSDIAASAYRAYAASTGNKNYRGEPMPAFNDLPVPIKTAWEAAVRQASNCLDFPATATDGEQRWAGWTPPQFKVQE